MKQHITEEQLKELTDLQRQALLNYTEEKGWYPQFTRPTLMLHTFDKYLSDCIGIGQMIEFLDEHNCDVHTCRELPENARYMRKKHHDYTQVWSNPKDLCDALWEACKEMLK